MNALKFSICSVLIGGTILLGCCSPLQKKRRLPECKELYERIEAGWVRDGERGVYVVRAGLSESGIRDGHACIEGLPARAVEELFGVPDTLMGGRMVYYLAETCLEAGGPNGSGCHYFGLRLDAEDRVERIEFVTVSGE